MNDERHRMADDLTADEERAIRPEIPTNLDNVRFILMETKVAGNIGAAARAMKGMGLSDLWLVAPPCDWSNSSDARKFAMNSKDVLREATEVATLDEAIGDVHYLVGTTHRRRVRRIAQPVIASEIAVKVAEISQNHTVAVLFGREDFGLNNDDLARCNVVTSIPMATKNPSLNLAQAVQLYAYEIFNASLKEVEPFPFDLATRRDIDAVIFRTLRLLDRVDFNPMNDDWNAIKGPIERFCGRAPLERRDLEVVMKIMRDIENYIRRHVPKAVDHDSDAES